MAPGRLLSTPDPDDEDPVTAEYDVYITPAQAEQILLLQYPNRPRTRPYNRRCGAPPSEVRLKPQSGHLEIDVGLNTEHNFNQLKGIRWGDALNTARDVHNSSGTYGPAAGLSNAKPRSAARVSAQTPLARQLQYEAQLADFQQLKAQNKILRQQTLGGQIVRHDAVEEVTKPVYFIGAFRDKQLHLTKVDGTVQMRPQFHHLDAEDQRNRLAASRAAVTITGPEGPKLEPRGLLRREEKKDPNRSYRDTLAMRTRRLLLEAEAEEWTPLDYVDEDEDQAYGLFHEKMFVKDVKDVASLKSSLDGWGYLEKVSAPKKGGGARPGRRKKVVRRKGTVETVDLDEDEDLEPDDDAGLDTVAEADRMHNGS